MEKLIPTFEDFVFEGVNRKKLDTENDKLFKKLVGRSGKADTVEGEVIRAINKIMYRHYNDGDYFYQGYGTETVGPVATYLLQSKSIDKTLQGKVSKLLRAALNKEDNKYEELLYQALELIINFIKSKGTDLTKNKEDMYDFKSIWQDNDWEEEDDDDDYDYPGRGRR